MQKDNKQFDIIDLLSIIIRYRKTILIGFLVSLSVLSGYFIIKDRMNMAKRTVLVDYSLSLSELPSEFSFKVLNGNSIFDLATYQLSKPQFLADELAKVEFFKGFDDEYLYNQRVSEMIAKEQFKINESLIQNQLDITIKVSKCDLDKADRFVKSCVAYTDSIICRYVMERAERLRTVTAKSVDDIKADVSTKSDMSFYQDLQNLLVSVDDFLSVKERHFVTIEGKPFVREQKLSKLTFLVCLTAICALFWVFVAICIDWISRLKSDEAVMEKLRKAWRKD